MRGHIQQGRGQLVGFWGITALAAVVYLLTMDRSASWWDCGEFIATSYGLGVGHPPGAPLYQLLAHLFTLLSFGNPLWVAPLSNALSALAGAFTVGLLYLTILELGARRPAAAAVGALCYLFADTVWFSAVESEVYALAMLFCAATVYTTLCWARTRNARLLPLVGLLLGLGVCVHLMTLLVAPALALIVLRRRKEWGRRWLGVAAMSLFFFVVGLSPYAIVPIRAAAEPPINEMGDSFASYIARDQYAKAPLYPRMWRERDKENWPEWTFGTEGVVGNVVYYVTYQAGYMYGRYLMNNYIGRWNMQWHCVVPFLFPALLGLWGLWAQRRRRRADYWVVMLLFLFGGLVLNLYLNHPCYEPRQRDYVYVLSFYAFALWIGLGAEALMESRWPRWAVVAVCVLAPLSEAVGNWADHDRHNCHSVHDISMAHLQSCDPDAILITLGDNDTFPLWYLQQVEGQRTDIDIYNLGLTGFSQIERIVNQNAGLRPIYVSQYFYDRYAYLFGGRLRCEGLCWRLVATLEETADREPLLRHKALIEWHIGEHEYLDRVSRGLLAAWKRNTEGDGSED